MKIILPIALLVLLLLGSCSKPYTSISASDQSRYDQWVEDIQYFETEFLQTAKTYTDEAKDSCQVILNDLRKQIPNVSDFQIKLVLAKCVALADNGHTTLPIWLSHKIPLRFYRFSDGIYVVRADSGFAAYVGTKVLQVNAIPVSQVEARMFPYVSGIERWKQFKTINMMTSPQMLHEIGVCAEDSMTLTLLQGSDTLLVSLGGRKVDQDRYWFEGWSNLYPVSLPETNWQFVHSDTTDLPLYLARAAEGVFFTFLDEEKIAYFHVNSFWDECPNVKERIAEFHEILTTKRDYDVVIDLRFYTGGNYAYFTKLATKPPRIIHDQQKVFLITSDKTYSAGIVTAARIKHFAQDKIVVVGEEVGDRLLFWAEGTLCQLPHSKIRIYSAQKEHDWAHNKRGFRRTHLTNYVYGVAVGDLAVDQEIGLSFEDYIEHRDPILAWILQQGR